VTISSAGTKIHQHDRRRGGENAESLKIAEKSRRSSAFVRPASRKTAPKTAAARRMASSIPQRRRSPVNGFAPLMVVPATFPFSNSACAADQPPDKT